MHRWLSLLLLAPSIASAQYIATDEAPAPPAREAHYVGWVGGVLTSGYSARDGSEGGIVLGGAETSIRILEMLQGTLRLTYGGAPSGDGAFAETVRVETAYHTVTPFGVYAGFRIGMGYIGDAV